MFLILQQVIGVDYFGETDALSDECIADLPLTENPGAVMC
jgi:hypothetical protein